MLNTAVISMEKANVRFFPKRLLTGAASTTPTMFAICPRARNRPLSTKDTPKSDTVSKFSSTM